MSNSNDANTAPAAALADLVDEIAGAIEGSECAGVAFIASDVETLLQEINDPEQAAAELHELARLLGIYDKLGFVDGNRLHIVEQETPFGVIKATWHREGDNIVVRYGERTKPAQASADDKTNDFVARDVLRGWIAEDLKEGEAA